MAIEDAIQRRYPNPYELDLREKVISECHRFLESGLGDANSEKRLCEENDAAFWQQMSEVLFAVQLRTAGFSIARENSGPDFLVEYEGKRIWIEVICPEPKGVPRDWLELRIGEVTSFPHEQILLRYTAAIKEKAERLIGSPDRNEAGYIAKGIVREGDYYVIAVNGRLLRRGRMSQLEGISGHPFVVEATLGVGPYEMTFDHSSDQAKTMGNGARHYVLNSNRSSVPTNVFLDERYSAVSGVWGADNDVKLLIGLNPPTVFVPNPLALNEFANGWRLAEMSYDVQVSGDYIRLTPRDRRAV
ncbi:MAG: hypothetical protein H6873_13725 [Hyphomicrobiaceae bacterium]|nr:hypothetical protein [Hyphomicrobiaceae bacterium]